MKKFLIVLFLVSFTSNSQISVGSRHVGPPAKFKKGVLQKFKESKTIFVFSNIYEKNLYEKILKDSWDVTPYEVVSNESFNITDYLDGKHSFATLEGNLMKIKKSSFSYTRLYTYFDISMYEHEKILKKISSNNKKNDKVLSKNKIKIAQFTLFPKMGAVTSENAYHPGGLIGQMFTNDVFFNYQPGLLKNYLQKINLLLKNENIFWKYKSFEKPELKNLQVKTLFIPSYIKDAFQFLKKKNRDNVDNILKDLFSNYEYLYEFIDMKDLNNKILNNNEFYYLRFVRDGGNEKFVQVVNSKTGDIIFSEYYAGRMSFNLKKKNITSLNKKIKKI